MRPSSWRERAALLAMMLHATRAWAQAPLAGKLDSPNPVLTYVKPAPTAIDFWITSWSNEAGSVHVCPVKGDCKNQTPKLVFELTSKQQIVDKQPVLCRIPFPEAARKSIVPGAYTLRFVPAASKDSFQTFLEGLPRAFRIATSQADSAFGSLSGNSAEIVNNTPPTWGSLGRKSVVQLVATFADGSSQTGLGVLIGERGELVTAAHVVIQNEKKATSISASFYTATTNATKVEYQFAVDTLPANRNDKPPLAFPADHSAENQLALLFPKAELQSDVTWLIAAEASALPQSDKYFALQLGRAERAIPIRDEDIFYPQSLAKAVARNPHRAKYSPSAPEYYIRISNKQLEHGDSGAAIFSASGYLWGIYVARSEDKDGNPTSDERFVHWGYDIASYYNEYFGPSKAPSR